MKVLGLDTSGPSVSVAIIEDGILRAESILNQALTHSVTLMPMIEAQLQALDLSMAQIDAFAVNVGPGSFTGVRIGVCAANAMAYAHKKPVIGVDALTALYWGVMGYPHCVCALIDARNGNAYAALYQDGCCIELPAPVELETYCDHLPPHTLFVGDGALAYWNLLRERVDDARLAPMHLHLNRSSTLCAVAWQKLQEGTYSGVPAVPMYLRPSQAERLYQDKGRC